MTQFEHLLKPSFLHDLIKLPQGIQKKVTKAVDFLRQDARHPSLQVKKLEGAQDVYEARVDQGYRLLFTLVGKVMSLLAVGTHEIIDKKIHVPEDRTPHASPAEIEAATKAPAPAPSIPEKGKERRSKGTAKAAASAPAEEVAPQKATPLTFSPKQEHLERLGIDRDWWATILACETEEQLLEIQVPGRVMERVLDFLFPKSLDEVRKEPDHVLVEPQDLERYTEGSLTAFLLKLDPEQEAVAGHALAGPALVKGGPGSGKSTVALYRVRSLIQRHADDKAPPRVLFATYTNALTEVSRQLLKSLLGPLPANLDVTTVDAMALKIVAGHDGNQRLVPPGEDRKVLDEVRANLAGPARQDLERFLIRAAIDGIRSEYFLEEFDWIIEGRGLQGADAYQAADRSGRGYAFDSRLRSAVWDLYQAYSNRIRARGWVTWGALRQRALGLIRSGEFADRWDYVIVDEAQDLRPTALAVLVELCRQPAGIFLTADACQSIYNRGFRFADVHPALKLQGRTRILKRNYRSTARIMGLAAALLKGSGAGDEEVLAQDAVHDGPAPVLSLRAEWKEQVKALAATLRSWARELRLPLSACGVLVPNRRLGQETARDLGQFGVAARFVEGKDLDLEAPVVKVMTIHSAKGLEFPIVALPGVDEGVLPRPLEDAKAQDRDAHLALERRLLFVGMTRAMRRLLVTASTNKPSSFIKALPDALWGGAVKAP